MSHNKTMSVEMEDNNVLLKEGINFTSEHIGTSDIYHGSIAPNPASPIISSNAKIKVGQTDLQTALLEVSSGLSSLSSIYTSTLEKVNSLKDIVDNSLLCDVDVPSNFASSSNDVSATNATTPATFSHSTTVPTTPSRSVYTFATTVSKGTSVSTSSSQSVYCISASAGVSQVSHSSPLRSSSWSASSPIEATLVSTQSTLPSVIKFTSSTANTSALSRSNSGTAGPISPASTIVVQTTTSRITPTASNTSALSHETAGTISPASTIVVQTIAPILVSKPITPTRTVPNVTTNSTLVSRSSTNTTLPHYTRPGLLPTTTAAVTSTQSIIPSLSSPIISTQAKGNLYAIHLVN